MAGSKRAFRYLSSTNGQSYTVEIDESNGEATCSGQRLMTARTASHPELPRSLSMGYILATLSTDPSQKRKFWCSNPAAFTAAYGAATISAGGLIWNPTFIRQESVKVPKILNTTGGDSGATDGDAPLDG